ncbi:alpha-2-HS-glycoprotein [Stegastes partitus]|uniref:Alpha-2-HS-glycoprotein-like n=1 Tax=Stegastes partitus TaxID=144197 RepID=A0A3B5B779_9TELE|nr:PREDICTED: alpha-2-HS-glycoprotein-like [Stegastes partitus]
MDKSICTLLLLTSLLSIHTVRVYGDGFVLMPIELAPIPCNDKAVEKLSRLAVTYINEDRTEGYKFALNRVANVHLHAQGPAGNVYYLDLDVLETKCHTGSPKPWKRCDVRPFMETQVSGNCNTTILHTPEGYSYLYSYDCALVPDPPEKLQQTCPTCPLLLPEDSPKAVTAARVTLSQYKRQSTLGAGLGVKKIMRAAAQTVPVKATFVEYTVQECPEGITERGTCQRLTIESDTETAGFCTGSVHGDMNADPEAQVSCEMFKIQNVDHLRPVQPQGHDLPQPAIPTFPPIIDDAGNDPQPAPFDPPSPTDALPAPFDPAPFDPAPVDPAPVDPVALDPSVGVNPSVALSSSSSSSESAESLTNQQQQPSSAGPYGSSSEEVPGLLALRPPFNFRYQKRDRKKRQALIETSPSYNPVFLADFPSGNSPFRSCPGAARYTTV